MMTCHNCKIECNKFGRDRKGYQRFRCATCRKTFTETHNGNVHGMYASVEKAEIVIRLLAEGNSIRSIARITQMHRDTIMRLLVLVGERCERMLEERISKVRVADVQCDERVRTLPPNSWAAASPPLLPHQ